MRIDNNEYLVECCYDLAMELEYNESVQWNNFNLGEKFYDDNGNPYRVVELSHDSKYIRLR